eukprot:1196369-Prorocentrum_minimum.AAC.2
MSAPVRHPNAKVVVARRKGDLPNRGGLQGTRPELRRWQLGGPASELAYVTAIRSHRRSAVSVSRPYKRFVCSRAIITIIERLFITFPMC